MAAVKKLVADFKPGSSIFDMPLGTGRFMELYRENNHPLFASDISMDMLLEARKKREQSNESSNFMIADAESLALNDNAVDYVVCIRLLNWLPKNVYIPVINELARVSRKGIVIGFRTQEPMPLGDFLRLGLKEYIPTPRRLRDWLKSAVYFARRQAGKVKRGLKKIISPNAPAAKPVFHGRTYYYKEKIVALFNQLNMELTGEIHIDTITSAKEKKLRPYTIYSWKYKD